MSVRYRIVVSAENSAYVAWQAKLAHYSCVRHLRLVPLIVVHGLDGRLRRDFSDIVHVGGRVHRVPNYRLTARGIDYAVRNMPGTLLEASRIIRRGEDRIVLCDPDMVFVRRPRFGSGLAGAYYDYMDYRDGKARKAMRRLGISQRAVAAYGSALRCGAPYVIPAHLAEPLARAWLEAIEAFARPRWEDQMHAFGLAAVSLRLGVALHSFAVTNYWPDERLRAAVVHYCYDNDGWSKRRFFTPAQVAGVWDPPAAAQPRTVLGEVLRQLRQAGRYYARRSTRTLDMRRGAARQPSNR